ncbi:hypothetical protein [Streptomyces sp. NPDC021139]|uniref:hypothetical protein n=1 Tax=Streptomyces sp. NPDC021139 TaxID=3154899 RepID=UPI00340418EB
MTIRKCSFGRHALPNSSIGAKQLKRISSIEMDQIFDPNQNYKRFPSSIARSHVSNPLIVFQMQIWLTEIVIKILSLYNPKMMLDWIPEAKHFKLTGYSHLADDEISRTVTKRKYVGWVLRVTQRMTDGSIIVELQPGVDREALVLVQNAQYVI